MKNIFKYAAVLAMGLALTSLVSCGEDPSPDPDTTPDPTTESSLYAFQYDGQTVAAGATVYFTPSMTQVSNDWASVSFYMENKTDANLETVMKVERVSGSTELDNLNICYGETCKSGTCPWTSDAFTLVPGVNTDMRVVLDYSPSVTSGTESVYRITIGKGSSMENPQVMLLDITGE